MVGSMGRFGAAGDNAAMGNFFSLLQKNVLDRRIWATREDLRIAIVTWTERNYHRRRRQDALGRLTPVEYEIIMSTPTTQVAWLTTVTYPCRGPVCLPWEPLPVRS
jgi:putative transposase